MSSGGLLPVGKVSAEPDARVTVMPTLRSYPDPVLKPAAGGLDEAPASPDSSSTRRRSRRRERLRDVAIEKTLIALRTVPERLLARGVRDLRRRRPEVFERLGPVADTSIDIVQSNLPIRFRLRLTDTCRPVAVVGRDAEGPCAASIAGPLPLLLEVLDGRSDADAAFFSRRLVVTGDTQTVVGLHNTLEAAELAPADLVGAPPALRGAANALARLGLDWLNRRGAGA